MSHFTHIGSGIDPLRRNPYAWQLELVSIARHYAAEKFNFKRAIRNLFAAPEILDFSITFTDWKNIFDLVLEELDIAYTQYMRVLEAQSKQDQRLKRIALGASFAVLNIALSAVGVGFIGTAIQNAITSEGAHLAVKSLFTGVQKLGEFTWQKASQFMVDTVHSKITEHSNAKAVMGREERRRTRENFKEEIHRLRSRLSEITREMQLKYRDIVKQVTTGIADDEVSSKRLYLEIMEPIGRRNVASFRITQKPNILMHESLRGRLPAEQIPTKSIRVMTDKGMSYKLEVNADLLDVAKLVSLMDAPMLGHFSSDVKHDELEITHRDFQEALDKWERNARQDVRRRLNQLFHCPLNNVETKRRETRKTLSKMLWAEWILNHAEERTGMARDRLRDAKQDNFKYLFNSGKVRAVLSDIGSKITAEWQELGILQFRSKYYQSREWEQARIQEEQRANLQAAPHERKAYASKSLFDKVSGDRAKHGLIEWAQHFLTTNPLQKVLGVRQEALRRRNVLDSL